MPLSPVGATINGLEAGAAEQVHRMVAGGRIDERRGPKTQRGKTRPVPVQRRLIFCAAFNVFECKSGHLPPGNVAQVFDG